MQLSLFDAATPVIVKLTAENWPIRYSGNVGKGFTVFARVDGIGTLSAHAYYLWDATQDVRRQVAAALESQPEAMF